MNSGNILQKIKYKIQRNLVYGWEFKHAGSEHIIKYDSDHNSLRVYAESYCRTHRCDLVIYNYIGEVEDLITFEGSKIDSFG
jgi:hypothetical protein